MSRLISSIIILCVLSFFFILPPQGLAAEDVTITLKLDRNQATVIDTVRMVIKVSGESKVSSRPVIQGLNAFDVGLGGTSSRMEIINGKVSSGIDYSYTLQPKKTGSFWIGPAKIKLKGKTYESNVETLSIVEPKISSGDSRGPLFLSAAFSKPKVYVEEQSIYTLKLYRQINVSDISLRLPEADYLTFKQLGKPIEYQETYNNQTYQVLEVRYALISSKEGSFGIRPARMNLIALQSRQRSPFGLFDDPFFSRQGEQKSIASEPLELTVLSLPEQGRPADYSGLVGTFEMLSRLEPKEVKAGESATLTITMKGRGNVNRMPDLRMPELEEIKVYSDEPVLEEGIDPGGIKGSKTMKWALVPEKEGNYTLPRISASYFDPEKGQYRTLMSKSISLNVLPGEEESLQVLHGPEKNQQSDSAMKQEVAELGRDILPVHVSIKQASKGTGVRIGSLLFWLTILFPFLIFTATLTGMKLGRRSMSNLTTIKAKRASKNLHILCKNRITSNELIQAIQAYLNDRFDLAMGSLTAIETINILTQNNVSTGTAEEFGKFIQELENNVYTGRGDEACEALQEIQALVKKLEKELR